HETVIKAMINMQIQNILYIIIGQGPLERDLKTKVQNSELKNKVLFLGYQENISELLNIADVFIFPSFREGLPVSIMEAMANGLPILASNIRGNKDLVTDGVNGNLFSP